MATALSKLIRTTSFRLSLLFLVFFGAAAAGAISYIFWHSNTLISRQLLQTIDAEITGLREQYRLGGLTLLARTVAERSARPGSSLYLLQEKGAAQPSAGNLSAEPAELRGVAGGTVFRYARDVGSGRETRFAVGIALDVPEGYRLIVGRDVEDQHRFVDRMRQAMLWALAGMTVVGLGAGVWISRQLLARVDAAAATSRSIMAGDLSQRLAVKGTGDELDRLNESLNAMLEKIEQLMGGLREVSDNIAHDLKSPVNRLRNRAELALREAKTADDLRGALETTVEDADRLIHIVDALLAIARLEAGAVDERFEIVALADVITDVVELYEPTAEEAGLRLIAEPVAGLAVRGHRQLLSQALANLIDNAIKYGAAGAWTRDGTRTEHGEGAEIRVAAVAADGQVHLGVADRGPGIAAENRERVMRRFVRLEPNRPQPGVGLGLSVVAAVARFHGGTLALSDNAPGLRAALVLPLAANGAEMHAQLEPPHAAHDDKAPSAGRSDHPLPAAH